MIPSGALLFEDERGHTRRLIESAAAGIVRDAIYERLRWDGEANTWFEWRETHWEPLITSARADRLIADAVHTGTEPLGYRLHYLNGITQIIQRRSLLPKPEPLSGVIPFLNGLLDLESRELTPATPARALDWVLPHNHSPAADCPTIKAWLHRTVEGDTETVELLRAWWAALLRGIPLQIVLMLIGRGGTGKGTFQRLTMALIGAHNAAISTLRDLEENRFETAKLYGKRLCMVNEAGKYGGSVNTLLAVTGGDYVRLERKHVQQAGTFKFHGLTLMASNEELLSTNLTSGLERRRVTVRFPRSATPEEKADWEARGGEESVLHVEIPGLVNWLLAPPVSEIRDRFRNLPKRVRTDNLLGMAAGNSVADWLMENTTPDPESWAQIGVKKEGRDRETGQTTFDNANKWLYANYLQWCLEASRRPVSLRKFSDTVVDIAETLGHAVIHKCHPSTRAKSIKGLRLADKSDSSPELSEWMPKGYRKSTERINSAYRKDRNDFGQNFGAEKSRNTFFDADMEDGANERETEKQRQQRQQRQHDEKAAAGESSESIPKGWI